MLERIAPRLDLSDAQSERLSALFDARRERFRTIGREMRREMRARFVAEQETLRAAIAEILTPAQMDLFDAEIDLAWARSAGAGATIATVAIAGAEGGPGP